MRRAKLHNESKSQSGYRNLFRTIMFLIVTGTIINSSLLSGCRSTKPEDVSGSDITVTITVFDKVLLADTLNTTEVWVEVLQGKTPVPDSTQVTLGTNLGTVTETMLTKDGLGTGEYRAAMDSGIGQIIAYALGVRDTITVILN